MNFWLESRLICRRTLRIDYDHINYTLLNNILLSFMLFTINALESPAEPNLVVLRGWQC